MASICTGFLTARIAIGAKDFIGLYTGDKTEFMTTEKHEVLLKPITKKVDDVYGVLHKSGRRAVSVEGMDAAIRQKIRDSFQ